MAESKLRKEVEELAREHQFDAILTLCREAAKEAIRKREKPDGVDKAVLNGWGLGQEDAFEDVQDALR